MAIPEQYNALMPYLIVDDARGFLQFTQQVFGAAEQLIMPADDGNIRHGEIRIGEAVVMFSQATGDWGQKPAAMFLYVGNVDDVYQRAIDAGAKTLEKPAKKDYGYSASLEDPFGNFWFVTQV